MIDRCDSMLGDRTGEATNHARQKGRTDKIVGGQIALDANSRRIGKSGIRDNRAKAGADAWCCACRAERLLDPPHEVADEGDRRLSSRPADVEINGHEDTTRAQIPYLVTDDQNRVSDVEEYESAYHGVDRVVRTPAADVPFDERDVMLSGRFDAAPGLGKRWGGPINSNH